MSTITDSPLVLDLRPTIGCVFAGLIVASVFYGVTVLQSIYYFQSYPNDATGIRALVVFIWVLDTLSLIFITNGVWKWLILDFANPLGLANVSWSIKAEPLFTATVALCVHLFMAQRIRILDKSRMTPLAIVLSLVSFFPFAMGILSVYYAFSTIGGFEEINKKLRWVTIAANVSTAVLDVTIMFTLCLQLHLANKGQTAFVKTSRIIHLLTVYFIANNLLTSMVTVSGLVTFFAAPKTLVYEALNILVSKAYANTFMAQLNARDYIRRRGQHTSLQPSGKPDATPILFAGQQAANTYDLDHFPTLSTGSAAVGSDGSTPLSSQAKREGNWKVVV